MPKDTAIEERKARYRQRLRAPGVTEVLFQLSDEMLARIDEIKEREGLRSRSPAKGSSRSSVKMRTL